MGERGGRYGRMVRHALGATLIALAVASPGAWGQSILDPSIGSALPGETVTTTITLEPFGSSEEQGHPCPRPDPLPPGVTFTRVPDVCDGRSMYDLTLEVGPTAEPGTGDVPVIACYTLMPEICHDTASFTLTVEPGPIQIPTAPTPIPTGLTPPSAPAPPKTRIQGFLLKQLKPIVLEAHESGFPRGIFDHLDDVREGESYTVNLTLPPELTEKMYGQREFGGATFRVETDVTARLAADGFEVDTISEPTQRVTAGFNGSWQWSLQPERSATAQLQLTIRAEMTNGTASWPATIALVPRTFEVETNWPYRIRRFAAEQWQWLLAVPGAFVVRSAAQRWKKRRNGSPLSSTNGGPEQHEATAD